MKIAVITMHAVCNYGSALQAYATKIYFEQRGYEVEFIDYYPKRLRGYGSLKQLYIDAKPFHKSIWKSLVAALLKYPSAVMLKKSFQPFFDQFQLSSRFENADILKNNVPIADIYCTGSDQVWNDYLEGEFDLTYFLDFVPENKKRISFAASFGRDNLSIDDLSPVKYFLDKYTAISVREMSGLQVLKDAGCKCDNISCVLDPTLMVSKEQWLKLLEDVPVSNYILLYKLHEDSVASDIALKIGKMTGKKVIRLSTNPFKRLKGGQTITAPTVNKFLSYIYNADLVVSDSFHATAFSINMDTPFIAVKWKMFNGRIATLLDAVELTDRHISTFEEAKKAVCRTIDFNRTRELLNKKRTDTDVFFDKVL